MATRSAPATAKVTRPRLHRVVVRERLLERLNAEDAPVLWISAPPGAGKTTLAVTFVAAARGCALWYQVDAGDGDAATFFYYMRQAAIAAGVAKATALPTLPPESGADLAEFSRRYFRALFDLLPRPAILVLDNFQEARGVRVAETLHEAFSQVPSGVRVLVQSLSDPPAGLARLVANGVIACIAADELRLTRAESDAVIAARMTLDDAARGALHERSGGWAAGLVLMMEHWRRSDGRAPPSVESEAAVFDYFAGEILARASPEDQRALLLASALPRMTTRVVQAMSDHPDPARVLEHLYRHNLFVDRRLARDATYEFHGLFRTFLRNRAQAVLPAEERTTAAARAAVLLELDGEVQDAIAMSLQASDWNAASRLIVMHARTLYEQGRWRTLLDAIAELPTEIHARQPWLSYWVGACQVFVDPPVARQLLEKSFEQFATALDVEGQILAAGALTRASLLQADWTPLDHWIGVLEALLDNSATQPSPRTLLTGYSRLLYAVLARRPQDHRQQAWAERALALLGADLDASEAVMAGFSLLTFFAYTGQTARAEEIVRQIEPLASDSHASPASRAHWAWACATHRSRTGTPNEAVEAIDAALALARENGLTVAGVIRRHRIGYLLIAQRQDDAQKELDALATSPRVEPYFELCAWLALQRGDIGKAREDVEVAIRLASERGRSYYRLLDFLLLAQICAEAGDLGGAHQHLRDYRELAGDMPGEMHVYQACLVEAYVALRSGEPEACALPLRRALDIGARHRYRSHWGWHAPMMVRLLGFALEHGIGVPYARELVRVHRLVPESIDAPHWPWPVELRTLGRFSIQVDGAPLRFEGKAQRKPLELCKMLVAAGESGLAVDRLIDVLWPDSDAGGRKAFDITLHRLRKLLGADAAVVVTDARAALNVRMVSTDAWTLQHMLDALLPISGAEPAPAALETAAARVLVLYAGTFLEGDNEAPWQVPMRNRLAGGFARFVQALGAHWEATRQWRRAGALYQRAIDLDPLAEGFYRPRMLCLLAEGRRAEALDVFRRCRQILSVTLGLPPTAQTEAVHHQVLKARLPVGTISDP